MILAVKNRKEWVAITTEKRISIMASSSVARLSVAPMVCVPGPHCTVYL